ncbi:restriction endonuclease subunit S [Burkholderia gladioli]|uniref:restriction endonuclease subunit S n=1 Tax=Burkholderia gladioli TaxID=28095 RepID=UPI00163DEE12|nr:restriction endonuclease subunit S [Burkholderia gladioli]
MKDEIGIEAALDATTLPASWTVTRLGSVTNYGDTTKAEPEAILADDWVLELEDIEKDSSRLLHRLTMNQRKSKSTKNRFRTGQILYGKLRPYLNKVLIADQDGYCTTEIVPIDAGSLLDHRYVFYWLKHPAFVKYAENASHGVNMPRLGTAAGKAAPFVLAPRNEQNRIADHLEILLDRVQRCNDRLDAVPLLLKRLRQTVLSSALTGRLTGEWREANSVSLDHWRRTSIGDVATVGTGSTPLRSNAGFYSTFGTPWITSAATGKPYVTATEQYVTPAGIAAHRLKVYGPGTLLIAMYGEGKTRGQVSELQIHATINQACAAIVVDPEQANVEFIKLALWAQYEQTRALAEGGAQPNLNLSKVRGIPILLPSIREQQEIVRRAKALLAVADRIEARHEVANSQAKRLASLVLVRAFRGELVPQDPNDEPASALLTRIAAERANQAIHRHSQPTRRGRPPRAPKDAAVMTKSRQDNDVMGQPYLAHQLRRLRTPASAESLFKVAELQVADFYKQLAWEIAQGHIKDSESTLEPVNAAG